jgi:hypothetical protein
LTRKQLFESRLAEMMQHNSNPKRSYDMNPNKFTDRVTCIYKYIMILKCCYSAIIHHQFFKIINRRNRSGKSRLVSLIARRPSSTAFTICFSRYFQRTMWVPFQIRYVQYKNLQFITSTINSYIYFNVLTTFCDNFI